MLSESHDGSDDWAWFAHSRSRRVSQSSKEGEELFDYNLVRDAVQNYFPNAKIHDIRLFGSTMRKQEWSPEQYEEFYGAEHDPGDVDLQVDISGISNEDAERWAFSDEAEELDEFYNYDVQLNIVKDLEETTGAAAAGGYAGPVGIARRKKRKTNDKEVNEAINYLLQKLGV